MNSLVSGSLAEYAGHYGCFSYLTWQVNFQVEEHPEKIGTGTCRKSKHAHQSKPSEQF